MKIVLLYLILYAYTSIILKPVMPAIFDFFEHTFNYSNHIATVHRHNGKYHAHKEYMEGEKKSGSEKATNCFREEVFSSVHLKADTSFDFSVTGIKQLYFEGLLSPVPSSFLNHDYPPPRA